MGYNNVKTGNLREQRRQQRRQETSAPVGQTGIGHGDGLRVHGEGKIILDGEELTVTLWVVNGRGHITLSPTGRAGLLADPAFWADEGVFGVAGPRRNESTAPAGYGGSNLFLYATSAQLIAGAGTTAAGQVFVNQAGMAQFINANGQVTLHPDGAVDLYGPDGNSVTLTATGGATLGTSGSAYSAGVNGAWSAGDASRAVIQGTNAGDLGLWAKLGENIHLNSSTLVNGNLTASGTKNFLMDHPNLEGHTIRYGSTESPHSLIQCRGRAAIGEDGTASVDFPEHFTAIVKPDTDVDVTLQSYGPDAAWCDVPTETGTIVHGVSGTVVAWQALAERIGGDFVVVEEGTTAPAEPVLADPEPAPTEPDPSPEEETP
ncbi:hypothetical protein [Citricoccus sp.]|uniref:hypothetical protein n=1 Tax=Citricoccus sp. TaxID=1978372 RepID=UPI0028BD680B|nr:hypothetical protein [Citricoccus sp.]